MILILGPGSDHRKTLNLEKKCMHRASASVAAIVAKYFILIWKSCMFARTCVLLVCFQLSGIHIVNRLPL